MITANTMNTVDMFRLDGQVALITGAAGLLGEQHAIALSDFGAHVILTDLNMEICRQRASQITAQVTCRPWRCSVMSRKRLHGRRF